MATSDRFDYIIVGAGSAGCVLANRLTADPGVRVLLLEAGGKDTSPLIKIPKGFGKMLGDPNLTWHFPVRGIGPNSKVEEWVRGKVLGGSSSVNGMIYNRGSQADYDRMLELGNPEWGWDTILPIFKQIENHQLGMSGMRGSGGPLDVSVAHGLPEICTDMMDAGQKMGWSYAEDMNETDDERIGPAARTIKNGQRVSAARAFLHPVESRPNLSVVVNASVTRVVFDADRAVGVRATTKTGEVEFRAGREVIASLGSIATPKLLQLSGIGDPEVLKPLGIDPRVDSVNVGRRMREHRCFSIQFRLNEKVGYNSLLSTPARQALTGAKYLLNKRGPLAGGAYDVVGFFKSNHDAPRPDAQILMAPFSAAPYEPGKELGLEREPGLQAIVYILRPDSEGTVTITSADPSAPLDIDPRFFDTAHDRATGVAIFRKMREVFTQEPIARLLDHETLPGTDVTDDQSIIDAGLDKGYCGYHAVGTAAMGPNSDDVVDSRLRVRGVDGLRVVDCSVMPTMVSGNLNGPMMAMGWRAAELILEDR